MMVPDPPIRRTKKRPETRLAIFEHANLPYLKCLDRQEYIRADSYETVVLRKPMLIEDDKGRHFVYSTDEKPYVPYAESAKLTKIRLMSSDHQKDIGAVAKAQGPPKFGKVEQVLYENTVNNIVSILLGREFVSGIRITTPTVKVVSDIYIAYEMANDILCWLREENPNVAFNVIDRPKRDTDK